MFDFIRKRAEEKRRKQQIIEQGRQAGEALFDAVDTYLNRRLAEISTNFLAVLRDRFKTIHDEPQHDPKDVAKAEYNVFRERVKECGPRLRQEMETNLRDWFEVANQLAVRKQIDGYIDEKIGAAIVKLTVDGLLLLSEVVPGAADQKPTP